MRNLKIIFACLLIVATSSLYAQQLTFKMSNPRIIHAGGSPGYDNFEFDLLIKASANGTYYYGGQWQYIFNNNAFSLNASQWLVIMASPFNELNSQGVAKYRVESKNMQVVESSSQLFFSITGDDNALASGLDGGNAGGPTDDWVELTTSYQTLCTVKGRITSSTEITGIGFNESVSNGQQAKVIGVYDVDYYSNPCLFEGNFNSVYAGRIFSSSGWSQAGSTTNGQSVNWSNAVNTSVWEGNASVPSSGISNAGNLRIHSGATLSIPATGQLTAAGIENNTANGITILSDATSTGSLITSAATGSAIFQRFMTENAWHQVSSPVVGQSFQSFLAANTNIPSKPGSPVLRGMMDYNTAADAWSAFFPEDKSGSVAMGTGYMVRTTTPSVVTFNGTLTAGTQNVTVTRTDAAGWNCIGNPYSSALNAKTFINAQLASFDGAYAGIYVWNQVQNKYENINLTTDDAVAYAAVGQGFFVKPVLNPAQPMSFTTAMQAHNNIALKSKSVVPEIKLVARNGNQDAITKIKFIDSASTGLDVGYDAGIFKSDAELSLYTKLVDDNGIDFMLQCLPDAQSASMIIPVGIDSKSGGEVIFSAETSSLSPGTMVILEDKVTKVFTDLAKNVYSTTLEANSKTSDRFQLHTSHLTTGLSLSDLQGNLSAYAVRNVEMIVRGEVSGLAIATLYDLTGRKVLSKHLDAGVRNAIRLPMIKPGVYMLFVKDNDKVQGFKVPVNE